MITIKPNSNPTNSELDAKQLVTHKQLSFPQLDELIEQYVELVVDNMSEESLVCYAQEQMRDYFTKLSQHDLKEEIDCYQEDLYSELVDNILSPTITPAISDTNAYKSIPSRY